jgi:hypothetical protein
MDDALPGFFYSVNVRHECRLEASADCRKTSTRWEIRAQLQLPDQFLFIAPRPRPRPTRTPLYLSIALMRETIRPSISESDPSRHTWKEMIFPPK